MVYLIVFLVFFLVLVLGTVGVYNKLIKMRQRVKNAWSQIDVQLKRRHDLIPNLVEVAKGYMSHEMETLEKVVKARNLASQSSTVRGKSEAENFLTQTLRSLFAVVENYPNLKADQHMLSLQEELSNTENRISFARQFYNDEAMKFNTLTEVFPSNIISHAFNFSREDFFELEDADRKEAPRVDLGR